MVKGIFSVGRGVGVAILACSWLADDAFGQYVTNQEYVGVFKVIEATLAHQPNIRLQEVQADFSRGTLSYYQGVFDPNFNIGLDSQREAVPLRQSIEEQTGKSRDVQVQNAYQVGLTKKFRSGISAGPRVGVTRMDDENSADPPQNNANVNFIVTVPLLKGLGEVSADADERWAKAELMGKEHDVMQSLSSSVLDSLRTYWQLYALQQQLVMWKQSETRAAQQVVQSKKLVQADVIPRSDVVQFEASLASKTAARLTTEKQIVQARQSLFVAMGYTILDLTNQCLASGPFPEIDPQIDALLNNTEHYLSLAKKNREDLMAAFSYEKAAEARMLGARHDLLPQLDLQLSAGYNGLDETAAASGYYQSFDRNIAGLNAAATLTYQFPVGNRAAKGIYLQYKALYDQMGIQRFNLERQIMMDVAVALSVVNQTAKELRFNLEAEARYYQAMESEQTKLLSGLSTVSDVITQEDRWRSAVISKISSWQNYAVAVAQLRYATGTLLDISEQRGSVHIGWLLKPTED